MVPVEPPAATTPEEDPKVAMPVLVLNHAPEAGVAVIVVVVNTQIDDDPPVIEGVGLTEITAFPDIPTAQLE